MNAPISAPEPAAAFNADLLAAKHEALRLLARDVAFQRQPITEFAALKAARSAALATLRTPFVRLDPADPPPHPAPPHAPRPPQPANPDAPPNPTIHAPTSRDREPSHSTAGTSASAPPTPPHSPKARALISRLDRLLQTPAAAPRHVHTLLAKSGKG